MTRRRLLALASLLPLKAQQRVGYRAYARVWPDFLRRQVVAAYERRRHALETLATVEQVQARQRWVRETFWQLVGGEPQRTPLNARVVGSVEREGYRIEKIVLESRPQFHIPVNLYIPRQGRSPYPAVLFQMGHAEIGKAAEPYQKCCQGLVQLGFIVLAFDPMGQGERIYYPDVSGVRSRLDSADAEHTVPGQQMLLVGDSSTRLQTWDAVRCLDYLASHPLVDSKRLASAGQSGGATLSMMLAAVDDRLAAVAATCGNTENFLYSPFIPPGATDDAEQNFVDGALHGFDRWDLLYPLAPKPLLILVSARDFFGTYSPNYLQSGYEEFEHLKRIYKLFGKENNLAWMETPLPHALAYFPRLEIYRWLRRHLQPGEPPVTQEPPVRPEKEQILWVSGAGNVVREYGGKTPLGLIETPKSEGRADWKALLRFEQPLNANVRILGSVPTAPGRALAVETESEPGVFIPAWVYIPKQPRRGARLLLMLEPGGRNVRWGEGELYESLCARGAVVCAADVRGIGDLTPEFGSGPARHARSHHDEQHWAWASLILGRTLVGQRVTDILAMVRGLEQRPEARGLPIQLCALGKMTVPALFAAAFEPAIGQVYLAGGLVSFRSLLETRDYKHPFANFVPRILLHGDLPDVARLLAPRKLTIAGAVDAAEKAVPVAEVRHLYDGLRHVRILAEPRWTASAILD
jgi:acetyl esterase/lipase